MSNNSLSSLLAWMEQKSRLLDWGMIFAFDRRKANLLINQEYIRRFDSGSYLPVVQGEVPIVENEWLEFIHDFVMDVPRLSFKKAKLSDSKATLTMAVVGGSQITMKRESHGWKINKLDETDPLQGPRLFLELLLNDVPGDIDKDGLVRLDLKESSNFRFTFGESKYQRGVGGAFFKDLFNTLPDEKRIYPLGKIQRGTNEMMNPTSFELRTQSSRLDDDDPEGAILVLVRTMARNGGNYPGDSYRYLIPDDAGKNYSSTVLFDPVRVGASTMIFEVAKLLDISENGNFDYVYNNEGDLVSATLKAGSVTVPEINVKVDAPVAGGSTVSVDLKLEKLVFSAASPTAMVLGTTDGKPTLTWRSVAEANCSLRSAGQAPYEKVVGCDFELVIAYELVDDNSGVMLKQQSFMLEHNAEFLDKTETDNFWDMIKLYFILDFMKKELLEKALKTQLESAFKEKFALDILINDFIKESIKMNFGQVIQGDELYAPLEIGFFGRINPTQTSFMVSPIEPLLKQGSNQQFTTDPVVSGLQWKVENIPGGTGSPGTINSSGLYQAPTSISGRSTRVRVTASAPGTGYFSSALVTVVTNDLTVNPLISVCNVGSTVELMAGSLGPGALIWTIKNPVVGESGELKPKEYPGGDTGDDPEGVHVYVHGPVVANKTFVLDEVEVKRATGGAARTVHVLALQQVPGTVISIETMDLAKGQVKLQAIVNNNPVDAEWTLPLNGPGLIDETGFYRADMNATERFVLIFALVDGGPFGKFEGYQILPLPLVEFPKVMEVFRR